MASIDDSSSHGVTSLSGSRHNTGGNEDNKYNDATKSSRKQNALKPVASSVRASVQPFATRLFGNDAATNDVDEGEKKKSKNKQIAQWPYDDYHEIQNRYYQVVDNAKLEDEATPSYVHRPQDMPDIPTAVQGLPLPEFAMTAEDRAIGIVSTWIFDAGLIDELLLEAPIQQADAEYDEDGRKTSSGGSTQKMDKEIAKLREQTARDLALINSRLNDGVAASGSEVQELVNAVEATKSDLTRLRQLTTYISNGGNLEHKHSFLLTNHPKLKTAINSRRNLARCFRELDFFSQIPSTCDRMREQLNSCEWTDHEWTTIRDVCREHVELQIFLVEAEAGMKARMDLEGELETTSYDHRGRAIQGLRKMGNSFRYAPSGNNHDSVDRFLNEHVKNVWEVGDEIRLRVLSGVGSALDLARQDPAGMVALIEAVEVYESAADEYRRVHGGVDPTRTQINNSKQKHMNSISDMRRAALEHIADDFQARGEEVFNSMIQKVKEDNTDPYADLAPAEFNAVLRAAQSLTYQIELVRQHMTPCFPPFWNVDTLWMTCVAAVCSEHIMHHIGGQKGDNLSYMTVTQLLDLVAWIESFREKVEESFPNLIQFNTRSESKTNFISMKELMKGKEIDMKSAKENLSWVTNVLWDVHRLAQDQFILRTQDQTQQWLENVYSANHAKSQTGDGHLTTSLPEDVFALAGVQLRTIRERLTKKSSVLVDAVTIVFMSMQQKQRNSRNGFLKDLETCCAAANDFVRMTDQCDEIVEELLENTDLPSQDQQTVQEVANELMRQYTNDAMFAAQSIHKYIFEPIEEDLGTRIFSESWENDSSNEAALTIVKTIEDFMTDIEEWMEEVMVRKLVDGLVRASINFYLKHLILKAEKTAKKESSFLDKDKAMTRINGDISHIRNFFQGMTDSFPALQRVINSEFEIMTNIFAILYLAANDGDDPQDHFPSIQKAIKNVDVCRFLIGDLYHLVAPDKERGIYEVFEAHEDQLRAFEINEAYIDEQFVDETLQLNKIVMKVIGESKRKRPMKGETLKAMEKTFGNWGWIAGGAAGETAEEENVTHD